MHAPAQGGRSGLGRGGLGREGEDAAVDALRARGYRILERNVRLRRGELDIVAQDAGQLVFVEVKARRGRGYGTPAEAVDARKRARLVRLAAAYLAARRLAERPCRFDVVEVRVDGAGRPSVEILKNAFGA
jgi:putative endonuclease